MTNITIDVQCNLCELIKKIGENGSNNDHQQQQQ